jgi:hypothetical protein
LALCPEIQIRQLAQKKVVSEGVEAIRLGPVVGVVGVEAIRLGPVVGVVGVEAIRLGPVVEVVGVEAVRLGQVVEVVGVAGVRLGQVVGVVGVVVIRPGQVVEGGDEGAIRLGPKVGVEAEDWVAIRRGREEHRVLPTDECIDPLRHTIRTLRKRDTRECQRRHQA